MIAARTVGNLPCGIVGAETAASVPPVTDDDGRRAVAAALRDLAERVAVADAPAETWAAVEGLVAEAATQLPTAADAASAFARRVADLRASTAPGGGPDLDVVAQHPLAHATSAVYPPIELTFTDDGGLVAEVTFGPAWEGPPDLVHGGFVAAGFDIVCSALAGRRQGPTVTRHLHVRYLKPTPYEHPLRYEVTVEREEGRLLDLRATLLVEGRVRARATAQFAALPRR
jgi:acyl-coenzyme A thioesterase PaaI-like protein